MDKSQRPLLDEFGQALMAEVRDEACAYLQRVISGKMADKESKKLFQELRKLSARDADLVGRLLVCAVDAGIVRFLHFLDVNEIEVLFTDQAGGKHDVRAISDGLVGELYTEDGWIAKYSKFYDRIERLP